MGFKDALSKLILGDGKLSVPVSGGNILALALCSAAMGLIVVLLDWIIFTVKGKSALNLSYGSRLTTTFRLLFLWGIGAGLGSILGFAFEILQPTRAAYIGFGVAWPLVLPRIVDQVDREIKQDAEPEQVPQEGRDDNP
jgi:hypothetical protein